MKKISLIVAIVFIVLFSFCLFISFPRKSKADNFKKVELDSTVQITNLTGVPYLDTIVSVGYTTFDVKGVFIVIVPLEKKYMEDLELLAYIENEGSNYKIAIRTNLSKQEYFNVLSHELIHAVQYHSGHLKEVENGVMYKGAYYSHSTPYNDRPWENVAFQLEGQLHLILMSSVY